MQTINKIKKYFLRKKIQNTDVIKLIAGAGSTRFDGWIATDVGVFDITAESDYVYLFGDEKRIDNILLEHVIEHLEYDNFLSFLSIAKKYLVHGGAIRIAVPDAYHPSKYVCELTGKNGVEPGADDHKYHYNIDDFEKIAERCGYKIEGLEYFDKERIFYTSDLNFENGYISRCSKNYKGRFTNDKNEYEKMINSVPRHLREQFKTNNISYTSLLVDFYNE